MKFLKHKTKSIFAIISETTVYIILNEKIVKHFPLEHLKQKDYIETDSFLIDFVQAKKDYDIHNIEKEKEKKLKKELEAKALYETRKENILNIKKWRRGEIKAYKIFTCNVPVETFNKNPSYYGEYTPIIFEIDKKNILNQFKHTINSWKPECEDSYNNVIGQVSLFEYNIPIEDRKQITSIEELERLQIDWDPIQEEFFSQDLPKDCIIVNMTEFRGEFHKKYYKPFSLHVIGDYLGSPSHWRKIENYSDLWGEWVFQSLEDYVEKFYNDENAIELLKEKFSKDEAVKTYGLTKESAGWIYE